MWASLHPQGLRLLSWLRTEQSLFLGPDHDATVKSLALGSEKSSVNSDLAKVNLRKSHLTLQSLGVSVCTCGGNDGSYHLWCAVRIERDKRRYS